MKNLVNIKDLVKTNITCKVVRRDEFTRETMNSFVGRRTVETVMGVLDGVIATSMRNVELSDMTVNAERGLVTIDTYGNHGLLATDIIASTQMVIKNHDCPIDVYVIITLGQVAFSVIGEQKLLFDCPVELIADIETTVERLKKSGIKVKCCTFDFFNDDIKWYVREISKSPAVANPFKEKALRYFENQNRFMRKGNYLLFYNKVYDFDMCISSVFSALSRSKRKKFQPMSVLFEENFYSMVEAE